MIYSTVTIGRCCSGINGRDICSAVNYPNKANSRAVAHYLSATSLAGFALALTPQFSHISLLRGSPSGSFALAIRSGSSSTTTSSGLVRLHLNIDLVILLTVIVLRSSRWWNTDCCLHRTLNDYFQKIYRPLISYIAELRRIWCCW